MIFVAALVDPRATMKEFGGRFSRLDARRRRYIVLSVLEFVFVSTSTWFYLTILMLSAFYIRRIYSPEVLKDGALTILLWGAVVFVPVITLFAALIRFLEASEHPSNPVYLGHAVVDARITRARKSIRLWNPISTPFTVVFGGLSWLPKFLRWSLQKLGELTRLVFQSPVLAFCAGFVLGWIFGLLIGMPEAIAIIVSACFLIVSVLIWAIDARSSSVED
jgi:hypothetical protein